MVHKVIITCAAFLASAAMYHLTFYYAHTFFWLSFLYLVPLLYLGITQRLSWRDGFLWGVVTLSAHEFWVMCGLYTMATGQWYERLIPLVLLVIYRATFPALWFFITEKIITFFHIENSVQRLSLWVFTAWLYELWMDWFHLWPCGKCEGYIFFNPLIPFAAYPQLLTLLPVVGMPLLLLYLFACSGMITYAFVTRTHATLFLLLIGLSIWCLGFLHTEETTAPAWLDRIGVLQQKFVTRPEMPSVMLLQEQCAHLKELYPAIDCILCPESSIYEADLTTHLKAYAGQCGAILESVQLVIGGFYDEEEGQRNTAYCINRNREIYKFYKRHAMPLTERIPPIFNMALLKDLYFKTRPEIVPSRNIRPLWLICDQTVSPYICSELFFNAQPDDYYTQTMILAVCNDVWAAQSVRYVMYLGALFRAIEWQRLIIYITYDYAVLIDPAGVVYHLSVLK